MADTQIGNILGVTQVGRNAQSLGGPITADGANTVTVTNSQILRTGAFIDIVNGTTGAVLASNRQITNLTSAGVATYGGADVAAVPGTHVVVPTGYAFPVQNQAQSNFANINGGSDESHAFDLPPNVSLDNIGSMKEYLLSLAKTAYTAVSLRTMTMNDLVYACRQELTPAGIR